MFDLSRYGLKIGRPYPDVHEWFQPVMDKGRGAVFVDTSFFRALINVNDPMHPIAEPAFVNANANYYTTALVLAEAVRQIVKGDHGNSIARERWLEKCTDVAINSGRFVVCNPPADFVLDCYRELLHARRELDPKLDLCDVLSMAVLDYARHRRVFGFDNHFRVCGAQVEPTYSR